MVRRHPFHAAGLPACLRDGLPLGQLVSMTACLRETNPASRPASGKVCNPSDVRARRQVNMQSSKRERMPVRRHEIMLARLPAIVLSLEHDYRHRQ